MTAISTTVTLADLATPTDEVLVQEVGGEAVLLDLASERYFGLDPVGTRIWGLMGEGKNLKAVRDTLCEEYDADPATIERDLLALVAELAQAGLIKVG